MPDIKEFHNLLKNDPIFQKWKQENPDSYLCNCFQMLDEANKDEWQIGFYNKDDTITTFIISEDSVQQTEQSEIFKKPDAKIKELILDDISFDESEAIDIAIRFANKQFSKEVVTKKILLLQNIEVGQVYNITFVTMAMNTINIKIDAKTKEIIEHKLTSLMDFSIRK